MSSKINLIFVTSNKDKLREVKQILGDNLPIQIVSYETDLLEFQSANPDDITRAKCIEAIRIVASDEKWLGFMTKQGGAYYLNPDLPTFIMIEDTALNFEAWKNLLPGPYIKWFSSVIGPEGLSKMLQAFPNKAATAVCTFGIYHKPNFFTDIWKSILSSDRSKELSQNNKDTNTQSKPDLNIPEIRITIPNLESKTTDSKLNGNYSSNQDIDIMAFETEIPSSNDIFLFKGMTKGSIVPPRYAEETQATKGAGGFGWDPCFEPDSGINANSLPEKRLTYAQMTSAQKNSISHRSKALVNLKNFLIKKYLS